MAKVYKAKDHNGKPVGPWCGRYMDALGKRRHVTLYASKLESQNALDELVSNGRVQARRVEEKVIPVSELEVVKHAKKPIGPIIETFITGMVASAPTKKQMAYKMGQVDAGYGAPRVRGQTCGNCEYAFQHVGTGEYICSQIRDSIRPERWCRLWAPVVQ